jgi:hypothetical protein
MREVRSGGHSCPNARKRFFVRFVGLFAAAVLTALPAPARATTSGSGTLAVTVSAGQSITVTVNPTTQTFSEDVTTPGTGWAFVTTNPTWLSGWTNPGAFYFGAAGTPGTNCLGITVNTSVAGWSLSAYYTVSGSGGLNSSNTLVALGTSTSGCAAPTTGTGTLSTASGSPTSLKSGQNGTQTFYYYVGVQPQVATTASTTITITFTAQ